MAVAQPLRERLSDLLEEAALAPDDRLGDYTVDGRIPTAVAIPSGEEQLASVLAFASREGLSVVPRGSGSLGTLGNPPQNVDIVLATTGLEPLIDHRPDDLTVTVSAGVTLGALRERLAASGQWLPLDPPLAPRRTIGGILATDLSGPLSLSQGIARDLVIGMRVAGPDGEVTKSGGRVVKNVTGFDLAKLHIGALGTLGVILEASFKVWPLPSADTTQVGGGGQGPGAQAPHQRGCG
ncbi:MAG: FAD-binding oxidoreductase [Chloroflexi bacterium]|nr:FAD-binding oxidoreductase [Chloroflexota bacterium]